MGLEISMSVKKGTEIERGQEGGRKPVKRDRSNGRSSVGIRSERKAIRKDDWVK